MTQLVLPELTACESLLYERQMQLEGFGTERQQRLKAATVTISRVGGLGGTVAMLLARAGVGRLVLAHDGEIEHENLNRMHLAFREHIGQPRVHVFRETLLRINSELDIITTPENVHEDNVAGLVAPADVVVDGAPLFEERYILNRAAVRQGTPLVMAAQFGLEGYVTTIIPGKTPCLACIYPKQPDNWNLKCFPVIAPISTFAAAIAAMEAIKLLTDYGEILANILLSFDLATNHFRRLQIKRQLNCTVCNTLAWGDERGERYYG